MPAIVQYGSTVSSVSSAPFDRFHWAYQLSCSTDRIIKLLRSLLWPVLSLEEARISAVAVKVSESRHNSTTNAQTKNLPYLIVINVYFYLHCNYQHSVISGCQDSPSGQTNERTDYRMCQGLCPLRHNKSLIYTSKQTKNYVRD